MLSNDNWHLDAFQKKGATFRSQALRTCIQLLPPISKNGEQLVPFECLLLPGVLKDTKPQGLALFLAPPPQSHF